MQVAEIEAPEMTGSPYSEKFPREVEFLLSAMEAGPKPLFERQKLPRWRHRVKATLQLFSDKPGTPPRILYTRQVNIQAIGFLTEQAIPLSHGGILHLRGPNGRSMRIACTVLRCRQAAPGWHEGAVRFNREQPEFAPPTEAPASAINTH